MSSFVTVNLALDASGPFTVEWFLNKQKLNLDDSPIVPSSSTPSSNAKKKYIFECIHYDLFSHKCFLNIDFYNSKDSGELSALIKLNDDPEVTLRLNTPLIMLSMRSNFIF